MGLSASREIPRGVTGGAGSSVQGLSFEGWLRRRAPEVLDLPGPGFTPRRASHAARFAVSVSRNWRITFAFLNDDAIEVDLEDYHGAKSLRHVSIEPSHPGELLGDVVIPSTGRSKTEIARLLGVSRQTLYDVIKGEQAVTPSLVMRLGKLSVTVRICGSTCNRLTTLEPRPIAQPRNCKRSRR